MQIQSDDITKNCGVTTIECLLRWVERCIVFCENEADNLGIKNGKVQLEQSLTRALAFAEAAQEVASYILSWKNMEKSIHYKQRDSLGPLSQSIIKNFTQVQSDALSLVFLFKCMLVGLVSGGDAILCDSDQQEEHILEKMRKTEGTLFGQALQQLQYTRSFQGESTFMTIAALVSHHRSNYSFDNSKNLILSMLSYCVICSGGAALQDLECAMDMYLSVPRGDVIIWSIAVYLDRASSEEKYLNQAKSLCQEDAVCGMMPIEYLQKFMSLGESPTALSLLYQKWIDPEIASDVLGCIQILLNNGLILECYVQLRQYLRLIPKSSYQHKAKLYWQEIFASGARCGLLFQLIRLPISVNNEEKFVVDWLLHSYEQIKNPMYMHVLCLYFIIRGRTEEALKHFHGMESDAATECDTYLTQILDLSKRYTLLQDSQDHTYPSFMLHVDSKRLVDTLSSSPEVLEVGSQMRASAGLLFSNKTVETNNGISAGVFDSKPFNAPLHGSKLRQNIRKSTKGTHAFDKVLGLT